MSPTRPLHRLIPAAAVFAITLPTSAQVVIENHSFESPSLQPNGFTYAAPPGWALVAGNGGVFYPTVPTWGYVTSHGNQLLYTNGGTFEQTTPAVLTIGEPLTLEVDVIHRPSYYNKNYKVQLLAGSTVLAEDAGTLTPPVGGFLVSKLVFTAQAGHPALGQPIKVRLGGPTQCNFDNVRLNEPSTGCYPDCDASNDLSIDDFICFQTFFAIGDPYADCDGDSALSIDDFICFQTFFAIGC